MNKISPKLFLDFSEMNKCLLCADPACEKVCERNLPVGDILRSLYFENYHGAAVKLNGNDCSQCAGPCEQACVLSGRKVPVQIQDIFSGFLYESEKFRFRFRTSFPASFMNRGDFLPTGLKKRISVPRSAV